MISQEQVAASSSAPARDRHIGSPWPALAVDDLDSNTKVVARNTFLEIDDDNTDPGALRGNHTAQKTRLNPMRSHDMYK